MKHSFRKLMIPLFVFSIIIVCVFVFYSSSYLKSRNLINKRENRIDRKRLLCMIITAPKYLSSRALAIHETWALDCDKHVFISEIPKNLNKNKQNFQANETQEIFEPLPILQPVGLVKDSYEELTAKIYSTVVSVYERYNDYQWYLKADDDTLFLIDNLYTFLENKNSSLPGYYGHVFKPVEDRSYNSGGAGYVLSNEAVRLLSNRIKNTHPLPCPLSQYEDFDLGLCLRSINITPSNTIDEYGRERFHVVDPKTSFDGKYPIWFYEYTTNDVKKGLDCCSNTSISFHYVYEDYLRQMYEIYEKHKANSNPFNFTVFFNEIRLIQT